MSEEAHAHVFRSRSDAVEASGTRRPPRGLRNGLSESAQAEVEADRELSTRCLQESGNLTTGLMSARDDRQLIVADEADHPAGEHIDLATPNDGEMIPARGRN